MPVLIDAPDATPAADRAARRDLTRPLLEVALVNNMPDGAFAETERQFSALLDRAAGEVDLRLALYSLPGLSRDDATASLVATHYYPLETLTARRGVDAVIVTGTEPLAEHLDTEPYWGALTGLMSWAVKETAAVVLSCLAAHAAALYFDKIEREPLREKCSGVFSHDAAAGHLLVEAMRDPVMFPHSRWNDLPYRLLEERGYDNLFSSDEVDWTVVTREQGGCLVMFVQGHPEYSTSSLLREYRRDLHRFVNRERAAQPAVPLNYLDEAGERLLHEFASTAATKRCSDAMNSFPFDEARRHVVNTWAEPARQLYSNWIREVLRRKDVTASACRGTKAPGAGAL